MPPDYTQVTQTPKYNVLITYPHTKKRVLMHLGDHVFDATPANKEFLTGMLSKLVQSKVVLDFEIVQTAN